MKRRSFLKRLPLVAAVTPLAAVTTEPTQTPPKEISTLGHDTLGISDIPTTRPFHPFQYKVIRNCKISLTTIQIPLNVSSKNNSWKLLAQQEAVFTCEIPNSIPYLPDERKCFLIIIKDHSYKFDGYVTSINTDYSDEGTKSTITIEPDGPLTIRV